MNVRPGQRDFGVSELQDTTAEPESDGVGVKASAPTGW